jgi:Ca-activated chloride channel family protein
MLSWASASAFVLLLPLVAVVLWKVWSERRDRPALMFSSTATLKGLPQGWRSRLRWIPAGFTAAALVLAIVALARPQRSDTKVKKSIEGIDIVLCLDISDSMVIEDMPPEKNRMESAKHVLRKFVESRPNDRIGYVVFRGEAFTRVPMTLDHHVLLDAIQKTKPTRNIKDGTAIGSALATATARIKDSTAKTRVIVFATDGESNSGTIDPETALDITKGYGIRIYSIGIGKDGQAMLPIETLDPFGRMVRRYQPIHSSVNDELLGKFASETGGKYYRATDNRGLQKVFEDIDRLERTKIEQNQYTRYAELFPRFLQWAIGLLLVAVFLGSSIFRRSP